VIKHIRGSGEAKVLQADHRVRLSFRGLLAAPMVGDPSPQVESSAPFYRAMDSLNNDGGMNILGNLVIKARRLVSTSVKLQCIQNIPVVLSIESLAL
jgi:hypothetical protein